MVEQEFLISEAARLLGTTSETLRNYERRGLVTFRRVSGFRIVTLSDIAALRAYRKPVGRPPKFKGEVRGASAAVIAP